MRSRAALIVFFILIIGLAWVGFRELRELTTIHDPNEAEVAYLTRQYGDEARLAVETYHTKKGSIDFQSNREKLSEIATEPLLSLLLSLDIDNLLITQEFDLREIKVLEYTEHLFRVIGCGTQVTNEVTPSGQYVRTWTPMEFQSVYVFLKEDDVWKLSDLYDFTDGDGAIRDWAYVEVERKSMLGDLPSYVHIYYACGFR